MELVSIDIFAQNFLKLLGNFSDQRTVKFGSGAGPRLSNVCRNRNEFFVTSGVPSLAIPPMHSVPHVGSPENNSLYSGVRANFPKRRFITQRSTSSSSSSSVI